MKKFTPKQGLGLLCLSLLLSSTESIQAQCNVNDKYDKIVSGYHSSIALKDNGTYAVWGSSMQKDGAADQLSPLDINNTNYGVTGTIYKATLGGKAGGAKVDQAILLSSTGLWAWGVENNVLSTALTGSAQFGRITSPTGGVGSTLLGLPTGVTPEDVQSITATYQTLIVLTKIVGGVGGKIYILTQTSLACEANGGSVSTAGSSSWQCVKTDASNYLTNVVSVRGQVYNASNNAFIAQTSSGGLYTWGNTTYTGNGSGSASARNFATAMVLPTENSANIIPAMIGVTGGGGSGATTVKNTYYVLSTAGNLYSLGDNSQKQCGDFTTTERNSWVRVKKSATANDYLPAVSSFSCQEHNSSFPAVVAVTSTGVLYTWGNNSSGMCGRTDNGLAGGSLSTVSFDPGIPVGFTGTAVSAEMGGHTMVYLKSGSAQFCYVGHYTNGSMGDGTSNNNGSSSATTLKHDCASTPNISICGYVPITANAGNSTIAAADNTITANGTSTTTITIRLKDASGNNLTTSGGVVTVTTTNGVLGTVVDNNDGTYTVILTSPPNVGSTTIGFAVNGTTSGNTTQVNFAAGLPLTWLYVNALRTGQQVKVEWSTTQEVNVSCFEVERSVNGTNWTVIPGKIPALSTPGTHNYMVSDKEYIAAQVLYRVRQVDIDGKYTYSSIKTVYADKGSSKIAVYPVPASVRFYLNNVNARDIKEILMINESGMVVKRWKEYLPFFDISELKKGVYFLKVELKDGNFEQLRMSKY